MPFSFFIVFVLVIVVLLVRSCLLITLIKLTISIIFWKFWEQNWRSQLVNFCEHEDILDNGEARYGNRSKLKIKSGTRQHSQLQVLRNTCNVLEKLLLDGACIKVNYKQNRIKAITNMCPYQANVSFWQSKCNGISLELLSNILKTLFQNFVLIKCVSICSRPFL